MSPSCSTMPPISWTSKWRWPRVRLAASRTVAKAGTRRSSSVLPSASCWRNSAVRAFSSSSDSAASSGSSALMAWTRVWYPFTRRSLAEPKNLRASAPIMRIPAFAVTCVASRDVVHQVAYQLTVTRRGKYPVPGRHPPNEWELSNPRFNGKKRSKISAIAAVRSGTDMAGSGPCQLASICQGIHHFDRLFALPRRYDWASVPPPLPPSSSRQGFCMTTSFPETKTGLRFGLASLAATACLAAILAASAPVRAQDNPVLAKVNGAEIRQSDVALAEEELGPSLAQMDPATKKDNVLAFLIDLKIVAKAAEDKKVENSEDFKKRLAFTRSRLLMDSLLATEGKAATTDEAMKKVYEEASKQITGEMEVHARHILVETEDEAKAIAEELKKGGDFADLAKKKSKDPGAADGGDLGFFTKEQMVPEFSAVAFALEPGKISDPVKSQFGWHVIKVEEARDRKPPAFDQVKGQIETFVVRKAQADYVTNSRTAAKVERLDKKDEPAAATPAAPAAKAPDAPVKKK